MDIVNISALITQGKILEGSEIDPSNDYIQIGKYIPPNRKRGGNPNTYEPFVVPISNLGVIRLLGKSTVNMNLLGGIYPGGADQPIILTGGSKFIITEILMINPSTAFNTASDAQFWTEPNQGGNIIFEGSGYPQPARGGEYLRNITASRALSFNDIWVSAYVTDNFLLPDLFRPITGNTIYFSLDGAEGVPCTADVYVYGYTLQ